VAPDAGRCDGREIRQVADALPASRETRAPLDADAPLRNQVDLDSMDFLRFVVELHKRLGVEIPEADYSRLASLRDITAYAAVRLGTHS
jgi:acyl carrier protein